MLRFSMRSLLAAIWLTLAPVCLSWATWAQVPALILLTENNPPASFMDEASGEITGDAVEIVRELMATTGISYSLTLLPWNRAYRRASTEPNVCVFAANKTPEREEAFSWVSPIMSGGWAIYQAPDSELVLESLTDLKKTLGNR